MKINYLKFSNIGPYVGTHYFDLNTNSSKNIILIGGKNGAGKTTFLKAIKYGLFGCFSIGLKTESLAYQREIIGLLNNKSKNDFYIEIGFEYIENFETKNYVLKRSWNISKNDFDEEISLYKDGIKLDDFDVKEISDKIRAITSPQLINSFIYDGEKISSSIENGNISSYLKGVFDSIFNIDLVNQTIKDLEHYLSKKADESKIKSQMDSVTYINRINSLKAQIKSLEVEMDNYVASKAYLLSVKKGNMDTYFTLGGLTKKEQDKYTDRITSLNSKKEEMNKAVKQYIESEFPLYLNINLLEDAIMQEKMERQSKYPNMLNEIEMFMGVNLSELRQQLDSLVSKCVIIHDMTENQSSYCVSREQEIMLKYAYIKPYILSKESRNDEYKLIKGKIANSENIEKIKEIIEDNNMINEKISEIDNEITYLKGKIEALNTQLAIFYDMYEKNKEDMKKDRLADSSFLLGNNAISICNVFIEELTKSKLKKISKYALNIFNDTLRKKDFLSNLKITTNFDLFLYNREKIKIDEKTLSAGETQILISSLIWAMFKVSGRKEMFVFDTPLARLDSENRINFINKIVETISSQVVILSTDSEFVKDNLLEVNEKVYKKYLLEYNAKKNATTVLEKYFDEV